MGKRLTERAKNLRKQQAFNLRMDAYRKAKSEREANLNRLINALDSIKNELIAKTVEKHTFLDKARNNEERRAINTEFDHQIESLMKKEAEGSKQYSETFEFSSIAIDNAFPDLKGVSSWYDWVEPIE